MTRQPANWPTVSELTTFAIVPALFLLSLLMPTPDRADRVQGCLWDSDTLYMEAKGLGSLTEVITGRFDRFPPLYYEMRLERISAIDASDSANLELADYDNAAVACDRLGRGDDAIEWMRRKAKALDAAKTKGVDTGEHHYRYLANLGTFHAHRWLRGADRTDLTDLEQARDLIADAIEVNPDAHFGRERYQLLAIKWLLSPPDYRDDYAPSIFNAIDESMPPMSIGGNRLAKYNYEDAAEGLAGLIVLGNAWESPDIFSSLRFALADEGNAAIGYLAGLRVKELVSEGKTSLRLSFDFTPEEGRKWSTAGVSRGYIKSQIDSYYSRARNEAESWRAARNAFILAKLEAGLHPDTHANFWNNWKETSRPPSLPGKLSRIQIIVWTLAIIVGGLILLRFLKAHRKKRLAAEADQQSLPLPT